MSVGRREVEGVRRLRRGVLPVVGVVVTMAVSVTACTQGRQRATPPAPAPSSSSHSSASVPAGYPQAGTIVTFTPESGPFRGRYTAAGGGRFTYAGAGLLSFDTNGSSGGAACITLPDTVTVNAPDLVTLSYGNGRRSTHNIACPADLVSVRVTVSVPGVDETRPLTIKTVDSNWPTPGSNKLTTRTSTAILPPAATLSETVRSPIRVLLGGSWYLQGVTGFSFASGTTVPGVVMNFAALGPHGQTIVRAAECDSTRAVATAATMTFTQPWQRAFASECRDFTGSFQQWLYTRLLTGTVDWQGANARLTLSKPGVGSVQFLYIG